MGIEKLLENIFITLEKGKSTPRHPFRYVSLATESHGMPFQRMVIFREIENNIITLYTDERTPKVVQLKENPNTSLLFYDPNKMIQIHLQGIIEIDKNFDASFWKNLSPKAKEDYTAVKKPGDSIEGFNEIAFDTDVNYFCKLKFNFTEIDYLKIEKPHHIRAKFSLQDNKWKGSYVVP